MFPGQPGKLGTYQSVKEEMPQLGKLLKKGKNLPDKYEDHLQEHRRMMRYRKRTLNYHQVGLMKQLTGTNEYLGRSWG